MCCHRYQHLLHCIDMLYFVSDYFLCFCFLSDPGIPCPIYEWVSVSLTECMVSERGFADLTDVTLADEDTKSNLTDNAKRAIQGNEGIQAMQSGDQCKFATIASGASW